MIIMGLILFGSLFAVVFVIFCIVFWGERSEDGFIFLGGLMSFLVSGFIFIIVMVCIPTKEVTYTTRIVSLQDNNRTEGSFSLGSGHIEGVTYYCYYYNHRDGGYALGKVKTSNARIVEWDKDYAIKKYTMVENKEWGKGHMVGGYVFYVPKGTVVRNFNLDAR